MSAGSSPRWLTENHAAGLEPQVGGANRHAVPHQCRGDDRERERHRDLAGHEQAAKRRAPRSAGLAWPCRASVSDSRVACSAGRSANSSVAHVAAASAKRNTRRSKSSGARRTSERRVGRQRAHERRGSRAQGAAGERQPDDAGERGMQQAFGQQLADRRGRGSRRATAGCRSRDDARWRGRASRSRRWRRPRPAPARSRRRPARAARSAPASAAPAWRGRGIRRAPHRPGRHAGRRERLEPHGALRLWRGHAVPQPARCRCSSRGWFAPNRLRPATAPYIVTGSQRSSGASSSPWNSGRATPTIDQLAAVDRQPRGRSPPDRDRSSRDHAWSLSTATGEPPSGPASASAEAAAEQDRRPERGKVIAGHEARRQRAASGAHEAGGLGDCRREQIVAGAERLVVAPAEGRPPAASWARQIDS